ncbi:lytic transglycosylase domain-containing protein [Pectobacterium cacticida]|uniref:lytic transglycosylase domain-containing protein n=1 Tax=Pectobacterium cacticida TaxID=69221 RepID=UPI0035E7CF3E
MANVLLLITAILLAYFPSNSVAQGNTPVKYTVQPWLACIHTASVKYFIDALLIEAVMEQESSFNPRAVNRSNSNGTADYGLMMVNSGNIPKLIREGIISTAQELLDKPCLNIQIGTRLLASHFQVCGVSWNCLGSYNAGLVISVIGYVRTTPTISGNVINGCCVNGGASS